MSAITAEPPACEAAAMSVHIAQDDRRSPRHRSARGCVSANRDAVAPPSMQWRRSHRGGGFSTSAASLLAFVSPAARVARPAAAAVRARVTSSRAGRLPGPRTRATTRDRVRSRRRAKRSRPIASTRAAIARVRFLCHSAQNSTRVFARTRKAITRGPRNDPRIPHCPPFAGPGGGAVRSSRAPGARGVHAPVPPRGVNAPGSRRATRRAAPRQLRGLPSTAESRALRVPQMSDDQIAVSANNLSRARPGRARRRGERGIAHGICHGRPRGRDLTREFVAHRSAFAKLVRR